MSAGLPTLPFGKGEMRRQGKGVAILAFGTMLYPALQAAENLNASVANMRWACPLYTSDAADEPTRVVIGGSGMIERKNKD